MRKYHGNAHISRFVDKVCRTSSSQYNNIMYLLIKNWSTIVGEKYKGLCYPIKVQDYKGRGATLVVGITNPGLSLIMQAHSQLIIERIAQLIGYKSIARLKVQVSFKANSIFNNGAQIVRAEQQKHIIDTIEMERVAKTVAAVESEELRLVLQSFANDSFASVDE